MFNRGLEIFWDFLAKYDNDPRVENLARREGKPPGRHKNQKKFLYL
jgi:hypothetical protein